MRSLQARLPGWSMLLGMFLLICGAKLWTIHRYGNGAPYLDDWAGEGAVIRAHFDGTLAAGMFFEGHSEHRIAFTRLLSLFLTCVNGQWDNFLEMVVQAPLHVLAIVGYVAFAGAGMSPPGRAALAAVATGISIIPFGWENTLWGFQSQFYSAMLFGIAAVWLCWRCEPMSPGWWAGALLAFVNLFTNAGGVFFAVAIAGFFTARLALEPGKDWKGIAAALGVIGAIAAFGLAITPRVARHDYLMARNFADFFSALTGILSWPCDAHWALVIVQAPFILLAALNLLQRVPLSDSRWFPIVAGMAYWIQAAGTAYKRCKTWDPSRYCDSWCMMLIITCSCLYYLAGALGKRGRVWIYPAAGLWLGVCGYAALERAANQLPRDLAERRATTLAVENDLRGYLSTGDPAYIDRIKPTPLPVVRQTLDSASIRRVLPAGLFNPNPPLTATRQEIIGAFGAGGVPAGLPRLNKPVYGSYSSALPEGKGKGKGEGALTYQAPPGTRQIDLQIAGYPTARGIELSIKEMHAEPRQITLVTDPGEEWETVSLRVKSNIFTIKAKDQSDDEWVAISAPTVSEVHRPGEWARSVAGDGLAIFSLGVVFFALGAVESVRGRTEGSDVSPAA